MTYSNPDLLVSPEWLQVHKDDHDLVVVDCPWEGGSYLRAHIPGAVCRPGHAYVKSTGRNGELSLHLPNDAEMASLATELGIGPDTTVVLYDEWGSIFATRMWWVLRYYGHTNAKVLNGGWQAWISAGLPVSFETTKAGDGVAPFAPAAHPDRLVTLDQLKENCNVAKWQVFDVRSNGEYEGTDGEGNTRLGHVPGAAHAEWNRLLENSADTEAVRSFLPAAEMQAVLDGAGVSRDRTVVTHCQAAVRATFGAFALELLGYPTPRVYDGSMAEWANRDDTPLE